METLTDSIEIKCSPQDIFTWFKNIEMNYKSWHEDHVDCKWIKGEPFEQDSILLSSEYIHGDLHEVKFKTVLVVENEYIGYNLSFPMSMISPKGTFQFQKKGSSTVFTATVSFRFGWLMKRMVKKQIVQFKVHMKEEGENLKKLIEDIEMSNT